MKKILHFTFLLFLFINAHLLGQKGDYNWIFGDGIWISFKNPGIEPQVFFLSNKLLVHAGIYRNSTISDCNGNLLYYIAELPQLNNPNYLITEICDNNHTPINSDSISLKTGLVNFLLPYPNSNNLFILVSGGVHITIKDSIHSVAGAISIIDRTKNNGRGGIVKIYTWEDREFFDIIRHSNGRDWWIAALPPSFVEGVVVFYLFTEKGIVDSCYAFLDENLRNLAIFRWHWPEDNYCYKNPLTNLRLEIELTRMHIFEYVPEACSVKYICSFEIDSSDCIPFFLPKSNKLYVNSFELYRVPEKDSIFQWKYRLFQYTISNDTSEIKQSKRQVGPTKEFTFIVPYPYIKIPLPDVKPYYHFKLGPNGRLYISHWFGNYISEVRNPDSDASDIIYIDTVFFLGERKSGIFPSTVNISSCLGQIDVWLPDTVVKIGTKNLCIPIYAQKVGEIIEGIEFETSIRFDAKAFLPVNVDSKIENGDRIVKITGRSEVISDEPKVIGWLCGDVFLGSKSQIPLKFESFQWKDSYLETETHDGSLTIVGVCEPELLQIELLNPINIIVHPNPVYSNEVEIVVEGLKGMNYLLEIYNSRGMVVEREGIYMEDSVAVIRKSLTSYPNGLYLFKVGTRSVVVIKI